ncbi:aminoglycoside phosphotransferase [Microbacterium mangrovi]|uniref:Aminoglycoside phosphotransferase n=1 Tax=Microbacterium mangrovi TaxID=1348253 RepID=A0A0B2A5S5_9MICO|nr:phosphotransferase [Microbacterium mangrovi]KHK97104.1 aminoglycoside phosphotransferase [Microbacterium mangrovi]
MHADQIPLDPAVARRLVHEQFPKWAGEPVVPLATAATTSYVYRIGTHHTARFPMREEDAGAVRRRLRAERAAMAEFAALSTVPAPLLAGVGEPGPGFPLPWSVQTWVEGEVAGPTSVAGSWPFAADVAELLVRLRAADVRGRRFSGTGRGGELTAHDDWMEHCLAQSAGMLPVERLRSAWAELRTTARDEPDVMSHGDLIPGNLLLHGDRLAGILDTGGFGPADPALDLVVAWHTLDAGPRGILRAHVGAGDVQWRRGAAWALLQALGLVWYYADSNPGMSALGRSTIDRVLAAPELCL